MVDNLFINLTQLESPGRKSLPEGLSTLCVRLWEIILSSLM